MNDGPISDVSLTASFTEEGLPRPTVIVGANGVGKSNMLSLVADALIEGAVKSYSDVLPGSAGLERPWFRIVGGATVKRGQAGGFTLIRFADGEASYFYRQKAGTFPTPNLPENLNASLKDGAAWPDDGNFKEFQIEKEASERIFAEGSYTFFPANRSEAPHWLNGEAIVDATFDLDQRFDGRLGRPLFVERGISRLGQWISTVMMDSRANVIFDVDQPTGKVTWRPANFEFVTGMGSLELVNAVLRIVLDDPTAQFLWPSRRSGLLFYSSATESALPLSALSSGQAALLLIFGTVLMQCDAAAKDSLGKVPGLCVIDEVDAHVHVDLAFRAIPQLIALLPQIQFIVSAHSPLFVLGMRNKFGEDGFQLIEMPGGISISSEGFSEFQHALDVLKDTQSFDETVSDRTLKASQPLILCEGETDPKYMRTAAALLGRNRELEGLTVDWIGQSSPGRGAVGAGKNNLDRAWQLLTTNPELVARPTLLLYDNDTHKAPAQMHGVYVRVMPTNDGGLLSSGIENLLPLNVVDESMYSESVKDDGNGKTVTVVELRKVALCEHLCEVKRDPVDFAAFKPLLDLIASWRAEIGLPVEGIDQGTPTDETADPLTSL